MEMKKRICIYIVYDKQNIIGAYIEYALKKLRRCCDYIQVVCNSENIWEGADIRLYAERVIFRNNKGFDAGGYKDALCYSIGWEELKKYDELVLLNDSFYGPFGDMESIFKKMSAWACDFWGFSRSHAGTMAGQTYGEHIQSYFLVFKKNVIDSAAFQDYWERLEYPETMNMAIHDFELGINYCLKENGFRDGAVSDIYGSTPFFRDDENPYLKYPLELIRDFNVPILKHKALFFGNRGYANALTAYRFIEENNLYPILYIKEHMLRKSKFEEGMIDYERMETFYKNHSRVFIYGHGTYGKNVALYFMYRGWDLAGFLVTQNAENDDAVTLFEQADIGESDGIIVAVGTREMCREISVYLGNKCKGEQLLLPNW